MTRMLLMQPHHTYQNLSTKLFLLFVGSKLTSHHIFSLQHVCMHNFPLVQYSNVRLSFLVKTKVLIPGGCGKRQSIEKQHQSYLLYTFILSIDSGIAEIIHFKLFQTNQNTKNLSSNVKLKSGILDFCYSYYTYIFFI